MVWTRRQLDEAVTRYQRVLTAAQSRHRSQGGSVQETARSDARAPHGPA